MARLHIRRVAVGCVVVMLITSLICWSLKKPIKTATRVFSNSDEHHVQEASTTTAALITSPSLPLSLSSVPPSAKVKILSQEPRQTRRVLDDVKSGRVLDDVKSRRVLEDVTSDHKLVSRDHKRPRMHLPLRDVATETTDAGVVTASLVFEAKETNVESLNCSGGGNALLYPLLRDDGLVRHCVSHEVIGRVPRGVKTSSVKLLKGKVRETSPVRRQSFKQVFKTRAWGQGWDAQYKGLNASGMGATLHWAQETIATLHAVVDQLKQRYGLLRVRLLDVPCGDMAWMRRFLVTRSDVDYTGVDIVPDLIQHHRAAFAGRPWKFVLSDVVHDGINSSLGGYDLVLCRTLLQHLFFPDVLRVLGHLSALGRVTNRPVYLLTTSFAVHPANDELVIDNDNPGRFRRLNVEIPPISLSPPLCITRDGPPEAYDGWNHFIGLWKLPLTRVSGCWRPATVSVPDIPHKLFSCVDWSLSPT